MKTSLASDAFRLTSSKVVTLAIALGNTMLLSRFRSLEDYGTYSQLLLVANLAISLFSLGIPNSLNFFLARSEDPAERRHFLSVFFTLSTLIGIVAGVALFALSPTLSAYFRNPLVRSYAFFLALYPWTNLIQSSMDSLAIVYRRTTSLVAFRITNSIVLLGSVLAVLILDMDFRSYLALYILIQTLYAIAVYALARRYEPGVGLRFDGAVIRRILTFSVPLGLSALVGTISIELGKIVIGYLYDTEQLAIYANASREMPITIVSASLTAVLLPEMARLMGKDRRHDAAALWGRTVSLSFLFLAFFAAVLFVFAPAFISLLYSDKYLPGVDVFRIYSLLILLRTTYFGILLNSIGRTKAILYSTLASLGVSVVFSYVFYLAFGFIGPALASLLAVLVVAAIQLGASSRATGITLRNLLPWRGIAGILLVNAAFAAAAFLASTLLERSVALDSRWIAGIVTVVWTILYGLLMRKRILAVVRSLGSGAEPPQAPGEGIPC